jgi:NAD(P)-dependent dehydrogenase (short-subunit alcohol dehydrogenase family)
VNVHHESKHRGRLENKVALVTGGASGIGRECCKLLASEGARVIVADINEADGLATVTTIGEAASFQKLDVSNEAQWHAAMQSAFELFGALDILVNCAGIGFSGPFEDTRLEAWNAIIKVNLTGVFLGCKQMILAQRQAPANASIVNISSIAGLVGGEDIAAYSATKGGVTMLTKSIALSCAGRGLGIRCNSVHPTYVDTEMLDPVAALFPSRDAMRAGMASQVPLGRLARPLDIAHAVLFLASDESAMVTGSAMVVDGGQTAGLPARHSG